MSNLTLTVEIMAGTPIERAAADLQALCNRLGGVSVTAKFNDVTLTAIEGGTGEHLAGRYHALLDLADKKPIPGKPDMSKALRSLRMAFSR